MNDSPSLSPSAPPAVSPLADSAPPQPPPLSEAARIVNTYAAPSLTFTDIRRKASWWAPWLLASIIGSLFMFSVSRQIGWQQVAQNSIAQSSPAQQDRMEHAAPQQQTAIIAQIAGFIKYTAFVGPIIGLIVTLIVAAVLLGTVNFLFAGRSTFAEMFAMVNYAYLPTVLKYLLGIVMLYVAPNPDRFNLQNPVGTNLGFYLDPASPKWLLSLAGSADIVTIWIVVLMILGCAILGRISRGKAAAAVLGWWALIILFSTARAAITG
jgi:hypothetical protein